MIVVCVYFCPLPHRLCFSTGALRAKLSHLLLIFCWFDGRDQEEVELIGEEGSNKANYNELLKQYRMYGLVHRIERYSIITCASALAQRLKIWPVKVKENAFQRARRDGIKIENLRQANTKSKAAKRFYNSFYLPESIRTFNNISAHVRGTVNSKENFEKATDMFLTNLLEGVEDKELKRNSLHKLIPSYKSTLQKELVHA